jgi:hypothetical protein
MLRTDIGLVSVTEDRHLLPQHHLELLQEVCRLEGVILPTRVLEVAIVGGAGV